MATAASSVMLEERKSEDMIRLKRGKSTPITHGFSGHPIVYNGVVSRKKNSDGTISVRLMFTQRQPAQDDIVQYVQVKFARGKNGASYLPSKGRKHITFYGATNSMLRIDVVGIAKDERWVKVQPSKDQ